MDKLEVAREEVEKAVGKFRNGISAGDDRIVSETVMNSREAMIDWLWELLQKAGEWKGARLVPDKQEKQGQEGL